MRKTKQKTFAANVKLPAYNLYKKTANDDD